jgi:hypothetical protein
MNHVSRQLTRFVTTATDGFVARFCPDDRLPRTVAGLESYGPTDSALLQLYARLYRLGVRRVAGRPLLTRLRRLLARLDPHTQYETWWSLNIAEALAIAGTRQSAAVLRATDSTHVVDLRRGRLIGKPNNYWIVMARLEHRRLQLGLTTDRRYFDLALAKTAELLAANPTGFFDDDHQGRGRYDIYSFHAPLTTTPLWDQLPADALRRALAAHERLLLATARPDGGLLAWGRSANAGPVMLLETVAAVLRHGTPTNRARLLALAGHATRQLQRTGWADDAITAHRRGMTHWYLGPFRLLEGSAVLLSALAHVAAELRDATAPPHAGNLFPDQDEWISFDPRGPGVWCYRRGALDFQLPLVDGYTSDYVAAPSAPGSIEQIVDSGMACGVPNVFYAGKRYLPLRRPERVRYRPGQLSWVSPCFTNFTDFDWWKPSTDVPGTRAVTVRVVGNTLVGEERWRFARKPDALAMHFGESLRRLDVQWECARPHQAFTVGVGGMPAWRSHWHPIRALHQLDITPARDVTVRWRLRAAK